jgi:hypothetical protein
MPLQRVRRRLTTEQLGRCIGMPDAGYSQRDVAYALNVSQRVVNRARNHSKRLVQQHTDTGVVIRGRQPNAKTILLLFRRNNIPSEQQPANVMTSWMLRGWICPLKWYTKSASQCRSQFEKGLCSSPSDCSTPAGSDWTGLRLMSLGHRTIGFQFFSPMSPDIAWTLQTGGTECGDDNVHVYMMPTSANMTVMVGWFYHGMRWNQQWWKNRSSCPGERKKDGGAVP